MKYGYGWVENIPLKCENAGNQHILLFPHNVFYTFKERNHNMLYVYLGLNLVMFKYDHLEQILSLFLSTPLLHVKFPKTFKNYM